MNPFRSGLACCAVLVVVSCGGGGDGPTPGPTVASVVITGPAVIPNLASINQTVQFTAEARDAAGAPVSATITWTSSAPGVASITNGGLLTAQSNGTTQVRAVASTIQSTATAVTVAQVPTAVVITPGSVTFGAIGSSKQLAAVVNDAGGSAVAGAGVTWTRVGTGTTATVSAGGLVSSTGVSGPANADSAVATSGTASAKAAITVTQLVSTITVTSTQVQPDTLKNTGSQRDFNATARDSFNNVIGAPPPFTWTLNPANGVVTVDAGTGLITAVTDGSTAVRASASGINGQRNIVVRRFPETFTLGTPDGVTISTDDGFVLLTGESKDSSGADLTINWLSLQPGIVSLGLTTGTGNQATAVSNGVANIVMSSNQRADTVQITVSNQTVPPVSFATNVMPIFTQNCALLGCHSGGVPAGGMLLTGAASDVRARLVNVAAVGHPNAIRVIPNNADSSYIIRKLEGGPNIVGVRMPASGPPYLPQSTVDIIRTWISQGALNN